VVLEQSRHADVRDSSATPRDALGDGPQGESLSAPSAAAGFPLRSHLAGTLRTALARQEGDGTAVAGWTAEAAQGDGMELEGGGDLGVGPGSDLGQLGDEHSLVALVITAVAGDQVAVQEDAALIVDRNDFQSRDQGAEGKR